MANTIRVVGIGPGNPEYITPAALKIIRSSDVLVGGERVLKPFLDLGRETYFVKNDLKGMINFIKDRCESQRVAVLASGDPCFYGILEYIKRHFDKKQLEVLPGLSSAQMACARLGISWHDAGFFSVHGRDLEGLAEVVRGRSKTIILTDPVKTPAVLAGELASRGITGKRVYVCENLSYEDERIGEFEIDKVPENVGKTGCVVVISDE